MLGAIMASSRVTVKITDSGVRKLLKDVYGKRKAVCLVGVFGDKAATPHDAEPGQEASTKAPLSVGEIAAIHEFGLGPHLPQRSWLRSYIDENEARISNWMATLLEAELRKSLATGKPITDQARAAILGKIGAKAVGEMQQRISNSEIQPPLAESTIERKTRAGKRGEVPLIFSGQMRSAIAYQVDLTGALDTQGD